MDEREAAHGNVSTVPFPSGEFDVKETRYFNCLVKVRLNSQLVMSGDGMVGNTFHLIELTNTSEEKAMRKLV